MYCSKCGKEIGENNNFCTNCGNQVTSILNSQVVVNEPKKKNNWVNMVLIGVIAVILFLIGFDMIHKFIDKSRTRTIMIYMAGADLESKAGLASRDLLDISYTKTRENNTKVLLMAGGSKAWHNSYVDSNKTAIYELKEGGFVKVDNRALTNMGTSENLSYFLNYVYDNYKGSKYNLIFWNHGGAVDGNEYDELNSMDNLSIPELKKAFEDSPFKDKNKLDAVSFRTCLNSTIEIANMLKDYSKYFVASEEVTIGSYFDSALSFINDVKPTDNQEKYGKKQIENYKRSLTSACNMRTSKDSEENLCYNFTYSIVDLSKIDDVNKKLDEFSLDINKKLNTNYNDIVKKRALLKQYPLTDGDDYDMVDLVDLANKLSEYSPTSKALIESINNAVIYNATNNDYSNGLSIYFPYNAASFLSKYFSFSSSKNYADLITNFYGMKKTVINDSFDTFFTTKGKAKTTKAGTADFEIELTDEQVANFAQASCYIFVDMKDGYHKLVYKSNSPYLDGNKLKVNVKGKMLRISDSEYEDTSEWLRLIEQDTGDDYVESNTVFILTRGFKNTDIATVTVRVDKEHPKGFIKSVVLNNKDKNNETMFFSKNAVNIKDYNFIEVGSQAYQITDESGKFRSDFLKHSNGVFTGIYFATNMFKLIPEDFNSKYDYYGVFSIKDVADNVYYSDIVKMN